ncbi:MAG: flagellar hook-length control protein FliK [Pseudomonadota bacterium]|nr:flagellar hook-length control protein FliK [Pseudomonadota bacterium]
MISTFGPVAPTGQIGLTTAEITPVARTLSFTPGEVLKGFVLQAGTNNRVLLQIGDTRILADTQTPLKAGEQLVLRVEETGPKTILQILGDSHRETQKINQYLILSRSQPESASELFLALRQKLDAAAISAASGGSIGKDAQKIARLLDSLVFSPQTMHNAGFVKDYIQGLGLLLEHGLFRVLDGKARLAEAKDREGVKGGLLKLTALLEELTGRSGAASREQMENLSGLLRQFQGSVTAIEIQQVLNVLAQEEGRPYFLSIPMQFPDGIRFQDLYIERGDRRAGDAVGNVSHRFTLFLDLDILGELMAEVQLTGDKVRCRLKCREETTRLLISSQLPELRDSLEGAGLKVEEASCHLDAQLTQLREEYRREHTIDNREALSLYA